MHRLLVAAALWTTPLAAQVAPPALPSPGYAPGFFTSIVGRWQGTACAAQGPVLLDFNGNVVETIDVPFCATMLFTYGSTGAWPSGWSGWADVAYARHASLQRFFTTWDGTQGVTFQVPSSVCGGPLCTFVDRALVSGQPPLESWNVPYDVGDPAPDLARPVSALMWYTYFPGVTQAYLDVDPTGSFPLDRSLTFALTPIPEPSSLALLGLGLAGIAVARRRRKA